MTTIVHMPLCTLASPKARQIRHHLCPPGPPYDAPRYLRRPPIVGAIGVGSPCLRTGLSFVTGSNVLDGAAGVFTGPAQIISAPPSSWFKFRRVCHW